MSEEARRLLREKNLDRDERWVDFTKMLEFNYSIVKWMCGIQFDHKVLAKFKDHNLYRAFIYDYQQRYEKAIKFYREALREIEDSRYIPLLKRQKLLVQLP